MMQDLSMSSMTVMELVHAFLLGMIGWNIQLTHKTAKKHQELVTVLRAAFPQLPFPPENDPE